MNPSSLHNQAMTFADEATAALKEGEDDRARSFFVRAFLKEKKAAEIVEVDKQPTRAVLFRSAAALAKDGGLRLLAGRMARKGLEGDPPAGIRIELKRLLNDVEGVWNGVVEDPAPVAEEEHERTGGNIMRIDSPDPLAAASLKEKITSVQEL